MIIALAGCAPEASTPSPSPSENYPVTAGGATLTHRPERVVSLAPALTEILFAIDAGGQVVAVDDQSDYPANAPKTDLSGYTPNAEAIAAYQPDLVVISYDPGGLVDSLTALNIPVYEGDGPSTVDGAYTEITDLGALTAHSTEADALVTQMKGDLSKLTSDLTARSTPLTYFYEVDSTYYTATSQTFVGTLFTAAGLVNIADTGNEANPWPQLSEETILQADPDLIFLTDGVSAADVAARPGWSELKAVKNGGIVSLDPDIASRWGPRIVDLERAIVDAVDAVPAA